MSKITLVSASDIALDKLVTSDANVRRIKAGVSVEDLAEDVGSHLGWICSTLGASRPKIAPSLEALQFVG